MGGLGVFCHRRHPGRCGGGRWKYDGVSAPVWGSETGCDGVRRGAVMGPGTLNLGGDRPRGRRNGHWRWRSHRTASFRKEGRASWVYSRPCVDCVSPGASACEVLCVCVTCWCCASCVSAYVRMSVSIWVHGVWGTAGVGSISRTPRTEVGGALRVWTRRQVKSG